MNDLTSVVPVPTPVALAGRAYLIAPLRLADMGAVQGWLRDVAKPSPLAEHRAAIASAAPGRGRELAAARAYLALEGWPVRFGTAAAARLLASGPGRRFFLALVLARSGVRDAPADLAEGLTAAEWEAVSAAAWGADPAAELLAILEPAPAAPDDGPFNWARAFAELAAETGWTFREIAEMTASQFLAYRTRGADAGASVPPRPGETIGQAAARRSALFAEAEAAGEAPPCSGP